MTKEHISNISYSKLFWVLLHYIFGLIRWLALLFVHDIPLSVAQSSIKLKSVLVHSAVGIPPLPCCVPCFNFPSIIMFPFALFTVHLRFLFNWRLVWIWIMQTERKYLLNKCACKLITCQDLQAGGWIEETWESAFVHHLALCMSFPSHASSTGWENKWGWEGQHNVFPLLLGLFISKSYYNIFLSGFVAEHISKRQF